ncbi:MAG: NADH-quinone oxidoreductase subunit J [Deltaproteobacteria bacterium]
MTAEGLAGLVFLVVVLTTLTGAIIAATAERLIRSVTGLAICLIGLAGLYYFLNSPFVALMEILIYVGAVCVTIVFGVMLAPPRLEYSRPALLGLGGAAAFIAAGLVFIGIVSLNLKTAWVSLGTRLTDGSVAAIGRALLKDYSMVFELISLVLLVAIVGALAIARPGRGTSQN